MNEAAHSTDESSTTQPAATPLRDFAIMLGCAVVLAAAIFFWIKQSAAPLDPRGGLAVGKTAPTINAQGWLGGDAITAAEMQGKTVVVNGWFPACTYCRLEASELIELYEKYHSENVLFLGLTHEGEEALPAIKSFLANTKISWPNGYGALETMIGFEAEFFPLVWVISPEGKVVWNRDSSEELADFLARTIN